MIATTIPTTSLSTQLVRLSPHPVGGGSLSDYDGVTNIATMSSTDRGVNFRSWLQSVDFGLDEAWVIKMHWYSDFGIVLCTMYEPPFVCEMDVCLHLASRCHWDDLYLDWDGNPLNEEEMLKWVESVRTGDLSSSRNR